jgi:hypothetical protein
VKCDEVSGRHGLTFASGYNGALVSQKVLSPLKIEMLMSKGERKVNLSEWDDSFLVV